MSEPKIYHSKFLDIVIKVMAWSMGQKSFTGSTWTGNMVLFRTDMWESKTTAAVLHLAHELAHADQIRKEGLFMMRMKYYYYCIKVGYRNNPYEIDARKRQATEGYKQRAAVILGK